jgi:hypothetical protein
MSSRSGVERITVESRQMCRDCGWRGFDPCIARQVQYGWEEPWDELYCPECGETVGPAPQEEHE